MGVLFAVTIFLSALLLFAVQPLIGKYILPYFGGTPSVWTACLLFFQTMLLAGYAYAHGLSRLRMRMQALIHSALLLIAAIAALAGWLSWGTPLAARTSGAGVGDPVWAILALLAVSVGLPYLTLAATGPLAQSWFSRALPDRSPYRLYALSNTGSLLALVLYPLVMEPLLGVPSQARFWAVAFFAFCALMTACGWTAARSPVEVVEPASAKAWRPGLSPLSFAAWTLLAACASTLLLAITNQISQDVAVVPFLWILPLSTYLVTFILCFDSERLYVRSFWYTFLALALVAVIWAMFRTSLAISVQLAAYLTFLFAGCMVCHGELVRRKPAPVHLTAFYLAVALGGAVGGIFVGVLAPRMFRGFWELNIAIFATIVIASAALWRAPDSPLRERPFFAYPVLAAVIMALPLASIYVISADRMPPTQYMVAGGLFFLLMAVRVSVSRGARRFSRWFGPALIVVVLLVLGTVLSTHRSLRIINTVAGVRNFYGTLAVVDRDLDNPERALRYLRHGAVLHGSQMLAANLRRVPTSYYTPASGIGFAFEQHPRRPDGLRVGVVGLGTGTVAALARKGDTLRFYEINPEVVRIAHGPSALFTYLQDTPASVEIVHGDARLSMAEELHHGKQNYDMLVLDAFSGDAIPVHLLTREAIELCLRHLRDEHSLLVVHISNQHLDLRPVVFRLAGETGLAAGLIVSEPGTFASNRSNWVLLTRDAAFFQRPEIVTAITHPVNLPEASLWTDEYSNLLGIVKWRKD